MVAQTPESDILAIKPEGHKTRDGDKRVNRHATRNPDLGILSSAGVAFIDARAVRKPYVHNQ